MFASSILRLTVLVHYWVEMAGDWFVQRLAKRVPCTLDVDDQDLHACRVISQAWKWVSLRDLAWTIGQTPLEVLANFRPFGTWDGHIRWKLKLHKKVFHESTELPRNAAEAHFAVIPSGMARNILDAHQRGAVRLEVREGWGQLSEPHGALGYRLRKPVFFDWAVGIDKFGNTVNGPKEVKELRW